MQLVWGAAATATAPLQTMSAIKARDPPSAGPRRTVPTAPQQPAIPRATVQRRRYPMGTSLSTQLVSGLAASPGTSAQRTAVFAERAGALAPKHAKVRAAGAGGGGTDGGNQYLHGSATIHVGALPLPQTSVAEDASRRSLVFQVGPPCSL